ncbi:hypothetical protein [Mucilaginibacter lacusdianchii]|uniref:hypothetical protein n=1 Tax=Mucilaginibacter lacusdianchii TaxID=2684211 RepID=UPI00131D4216|nr:hypothetical protein [Mucilaginibacter sp. JXJ CY 39]
MSYKDYFFLLQPSEVVKQQIAYYKNLAGDIVGQYPGISSTAHLSIALKVRQKDYFMKSFLDNIRPKIMNMPAINLQIDGFQTFNHQNESATIYAQVKKSYQSDNWFDKLIREINAQPLTPHITVTKAIPVDYFVTLWPHFKYTRYQDSFIADKLTILERTSYDKYAKWGMFEEIPFRKTA